MFPQKFSDVVLLDVAVGVAVVVALLGDLVIMCVECAIEE